MIYLDYAATTKPSDLALEEYVNVAKDFFGNPGSMQECKQKQEQIRCDFLSLLGYEDYNLVFTSGGTEANNLAILGQQFTCDDEIVTSNFEHASVYEALKESDANIKITEISKLGYIDMDDFKANLSPKTKMVCLMHVNNELGTKQKIEEFYQITKAYNPNIIFMVDGVQSIGKVKKLEIKPDILTFSSHKLYGPKAVGAVIVKKDINLRKLIFGGTKENNMRSGTQSLAAQAGFYVATKYILDNFEQIYQEIDEIKKYVESKIMDFDNLMLNIVSDANVVSLRVDSKLKAIEIIKILNKSQIYISSKSADTDDFSVKSRSLKAVSLTDDECDQTIRISLSHHTTKVEIDRFFEVLTATI